MSVVSGDSGPKRCLTRLIDLVIRCECACRGFKDWIAGQFLLDHCRAHKLRKKTR